MRAKRRSGWFAVVTTALLICILLAGCSTRTDTVSDESEAEAGLTSKPAEHSGTESTPAVSETEESRGEASDESPVQSEAESEPAVSEPEESSEEPPAVTSETFKGSGELVLYSDGSFLLEQQMLLDIKSKDGKDCILVYGYYGNYTEDGGKAVLQMQGGYYCGIGMENDEELAAAIAADFVSGGNMDASLLPKIKKMLMGDQLRMEAVLSAAEIDSIKKQKQTVTVNRGNGTFSFA